MIEPQASRYVKVLSRQIPASYPNDVGSVAVSAECFGSVD